MNFKSDFDHAETVGSRSELLAKLMAKLPALRRYINRIDARQLNFRKFAVFEPVGPKRYPKACAFIEIANGKLLCNSADHAPTEDEVKAIESELIDVEFPTSIEARDAEDLKAKLNRADGVWYECWNHKTGLLRMTQHAYPDANGKTQYVCWSLWSDGEWRNMEPDGKLPFYKPRTRTIGARLMIHEGGKAGAYSQLIAAGEIDHPWASELALFEHWGILGGAYAGQRADYSEIGDGWAEVVYACDNDGPGQGALVTVSRSYGKALKGIRPDKRFKEAWDMADQMPEALFRDGRYIGPSLRELMKPATWATEVIKQQKGKSLTVLKNDFAKEWHHAVKPEVFIHRDFPNDMHSAKEFNNLVRPYSDAKDVADLVIRDDAQKAKGVQYKPGLEPGIYSDNLGSRYINTHVPTTIEAVEGDPGPFLEFMEHLVPDDHDRHQTLRWVATLIARPDIKMFYAVLLISRMQGVGKSTLGEKILAPLVGMNNCSFPSESEIVDSSFTEWMAHKRLAVVHEIYAGHNIKAYTKLKSTCAGDTLTINRKYMASYDTENWLHILACSNSMKAMHLEDTDRRWFVPKVTENKRDITYWIGLNKWLEADGLGIIKHWATEFVKNPANIVRKGEHAPSSSLKELVIEEGMTEEERFILDIARSIVAVINGTDDDAKKTREKWKANHIISDQGDVLVLDTDLRELIQQKFFDGRRTDRLLSPARIRKAAEKGGLFASEVRHRKFGPWISARHHATAFHLLCTSPALAAMKPSEIHNEDRRQFPINVLEGFDSM
jgi:hypothetical protein